MRPRPLLQIYLLRMVNMQPIHGRTQTLPRKPRTSTRPALHAYQLGTSSS